MKNYLFLTKCAYIFHPSNSTFCYGTKETIAKKHAVNNILKSFHDCYCSSANQKRNDPIEYTLENEKIYITLENEKICVNPAMISFIFGDYKKTRIINNRSFKRLENLVLKYEKYFHFFGNYSDSQHIYSNKLKSLSLENFMYIDSLMYYRFKFKNNYITFIVSEGKFYNQESLQEYTKEYIFARLDITGKQAILEANLILDYLMEV